MVDEYDYQTAQNNVEYEVLSDTEIDIEGELLTVGRATLDDRRVERKIRIVNGEIQEAHDFYVQGELFHSEEWHPFSMGRLTGRGKVLVGPALHGETMPVEQWAESYCTDLIDDITEIWETHYEEIVEDE